MRGGEVMITNIVSLLLGAWVFVTPWTMQFNPLLAFESLISWNFWLVGFLLMISSILALKHLEAWEEAVKLSLGGWLITSPWLLGFSDVSYLFWNAVVPGVTVMVISALALPEALRPEPRKPVQLRLIRNLDL